MPLGTEVGVSPGHMVLDGMEVGLGPGDVVLDGALDKAGHMLLDGNPAPRKRGTADPTFRSVSVVVKRLDKSRCHLVWR